jgi:hypothetical protein
MGKGESQHLYVYISDVDISLGRGPSVNELEFLDAMLLCAPERTEVLIPTPSRRTRISESDRVRFILPFAVRRKNPFHLLSYEAAVLFQLVNIAIKRGNSFVITRLSYLPIAFFIMAPFLRTRLHLKTAGDGYFRYAKGPLGKVFRFVNRGMLSWVMRFAYSADVVTSTHKEAFDKNIGFGDKICVVDNKVNVSVFKPVDKFISRQRLGLKQYKWLYGYVGNDPLNRGAREAIHTLHMVRELLGEEVGVIVVGGNKELLSSSARDIESRQHMHFLGQVPYNEVPGVMACLDVGVSFLPEWHRGASEQKVRQYLACGVVPVVTPGGSDFVAEHRIGFVAENEDMCRLAKEIARAIMASPEMAAQCRQFAEEHLTHINLARQRLAIWE